MTTLTEPQMLNTTTTNQTIVKMVFDRWHSLIKAFNASINALTDEQLQHEIAPGRNRGIYLLGHMAAVHDAMIPLLGFGDKLFPELAEPFITSPDKAVADLPPASELRAAWNKVNEFLHARFEGMGPDEWFERHTAVSAEDFEKEPHRNKLNIIFTRTTHMAYHHGQFILIK
jgi:hypothetical protein